jgi:hypothetical protein
MSAANTSQRSLLLHAIGYQSVDSHKKGGPKHGLAWGHADHVLATCKTQHEAIEWAKKKGHTADVARVRHLNDKKKADHWRKA